MITAIAQPVLPKAPQTGLLKERDYISYSAITAFQQCPLKHAPDTGYGRANLARHPSRMLLSCAVADQLPVVPVPHGLSGVA